MLRVDRRVETAAAGHARKRRHDLGEFAPLPAPHRRLGEHDVDRHPAERPEVVVAPGVERALDTVPGKVRRDRVDDPFAQHPPQTFARDARQRVEGRARALAGVGQDRVLPLPVVDDPVADECGAQRRAPEVGAVADLAVVEPHLALAIETEDTRLARRLEQQEHVGQRREVQGPP